MYGRKERVLKGWEVGENYATMLNVPQSNKGYRVETKKIRGGAGNAKYEILEDSNSPPPQPTPSAFPMHRLSLLYLETVPTIFFFFFFWTTNPLPLSLDNIAPFTGKTTKT